MPARGPIFSQMSYNLFLCFFNLKTNNPAGLFSLCKCKFKKAYFSVNKRPSFVFKISELENLANSQNLRLACLWLPGWVADPFPVTLILTLSAI